MRDCRLKPRKDIEIQWGDPPKPNIWKVAQEEKDIRWGDDYLRVSSPLIRGYVKVGYDPRERVSAHSYYLEDYLAEPIPLAEGHPLMSLNYLTSHEFYKIFIEPKIADGTIKLSRGGLKLASSNLQAMWGDPPKPNMWRVKTGEYGNMWSREWVEVTSPNLYGGDMSNITLTPEAGGVWDVSFNPYNEEHHIFRFRAGTFEEARDRFLSQECWGWIKNFISMKGDIFNTKVASSNSGDYTVQWGDPPKPNMWKTKIVYSPNPEKADQPIGLIISSAFDESVFSIGRWQGTWEFSYQSRYGREVLSKHRTKDDFQSAVDFYLSPKGWKLVKMFKKRYPEKMTDEWKSIKIANDWLAPPTEIKLQWGDPPKPNMWKVVENKLLQFAGKGEEGYAVHSPAMVGSIFLTFKQGSYSKLEYMERGGEVVTLKYLDKHSLKHSVELMAHHALWKNVIKPAIKAGAVNLTVPRVASIASPNKKKIELKWGTPPKPNIWKVDVNDYGNWAITSPLMVGVIVYYLETGVVIYHGAPGRADVRLHAFDINAPVYKIGHLLKSTAFWSKIEPHIVMRNKVASSDGLTLSSYAHKPYFKTKVASASKVAYLYRKGQGFPSSINTHLINLLAQPQRGSRQKPKDPADFKLSIRGLAVHHTEDEWCLEFNYSYKGAKEVRGGVFLERLDSKYRGGQGSPTKQEVVDACLKATRGMMTFDYYR